MSLINRLTVEAGRCALVYRDGTLSRVLRPGTHRLYGAVSILVVNLRERLITLAPQEVLTSDAVSLRVTVALRIIVTDAVAFVEKADDPVAGVYLAAQIALRDIAARLTAEDIMQRSARIDAATIRDAARGAGTRTGIDVLDAYVKDVIVPAEIRTAAMQLVTAKARGAAQLEAARAENGGAAGAGQRRHAARYPPGTGEAAAGPARPARLARRAGDGWRRPGRGA